MAALVTRIGSRVWLLAMALALCGPAAAAAAQQQPLNRLPPETLDVPAPSMRIRGIPGEMIVQARPCRVAPSEDVRRRIVDVAARNGASSDSAWSIRTEILPRVELGSDGPPNRPEGATERTTSDREPRRRRPRLSPEESGRVAATIAGYWAVTAKAPGSSAGRTPSGTESTASPRGGMRHGRRRSSRG